VKTPIEIVLTDDEPPVRIHTCSACGTQGQWGPEWSWYGSWRDVDDGQRIITCCSVACRRQSAAELGLDSGLVDR